MSNENPTYSIIYVLRNELRRLLFVMIYMVAAICNYMEPDGKHVKVFFFNASNTNDAPRNNHSFVEIPLK